LFAAGLLSAGYGAITLIMVSTLAFLRPGYSWRAIALRAGGSWAVAIGCMIGFTRSRRRARGDARLSLAQLPA